MKDKTAFLSDQCKEIEENNRMGKTRDLFKKIKGIKETFHANMCKIKDRNDTDITETEDIKVSGKNAQNYSKKILMSKITMKVWSLTESQYLGVQIQVGLRKHHSKQS